MYMASRCSMYCASVIGAYPDEAPLLTPLALGQQLLAPTSCRPQFQWMTSHFLPPRARPRQPPLAEATPQLEPQKSPPCGYGRGLETVAFGPNNARTSGK